MRILIRTSRWAVWARRFGALALPLAAIPVLLHRERLITSENFLTIEAVALGLAVLALLSAVIALVRLWFTGDQGWWKATLALIFSGLCLAPASYFAWQAVHNPEAPDVTTDFANPPTLVTGAMPPPVTLAERAKIEADYPNARSRNYPIAAPQMFDVVSDLVDARGWEMRGTHRPLTALDSGQINTIATTVLGFRQEVVIRVSGGTDGATVAMRSASVLNFPDFGENGARIEAFLLDLDAQVTLMLRDASSQTGPDTTDN